MEPRTQGADTAAVDPDPASRDAVAEFRILHLGDHRRFAALAAHAALTAANWRAAIAEGGDLVLIEPPSGVHGWDPLEGELPALLRAAAAADLPTVRIHAGEPGAEVPGRARLELVETVPGTSPHGGDALATTVDTSVCNPVGWSHAPPEAVAVHLAREPDPAGAAVLEGCDPTPTLLVPPGLQGTLSDRVIRGPGGLDHARRVSSPTRHAQLLHRAAMVLDHPGFSTTPGNRWQGWLAALACGVPVLSVQPPDDDGDELPATPGVVRVAPEQVTDRIQQLLTDADARERLSITGRRHVLATADRRSALLAILDHLGVRRPAPLRTTVLLATRRPEHLDHALANVRAQRQPGVEVSLVLHGPAFDAVDVPDTGLATAQVLRAPGTWTLGDCLNAALDGAGGHLVTKMDDDDHYGPDHLTDLVLAWRYSGAEVVGKRIEFIHLAERDLTLRRHPSPPERDRVHVGGPTLLAARDTVRRFGFLRRPNRVDSTLYDRVLAAGGRVYGTHARDVVLSRHGDGHGHAWQVAEEELLAGAAWTRPGLDRAAASSEPGAA